jgi:Fe2+ transport system protein FeoA
MPNEPTMNVDVEPSVSAPGKWNARCGPYEIRGTRTPLLTMARKLLEAGTDPNTELRLVHRGAQTVAMRVKLGDAAKLTVDENRESGPRFAKYHVSPDLD